MASIPADAASATVGGRAQNATCPTTNVLTSIVEDMAFALWAPASAILVIRETTVKRVNMQYTAIRE